MSESAKQPVESTEVVRKLVVPPEAHVEPKNGDHRSPTQTERRPGAEVLAEGDTATADEVEVVRKLVGPDLLPEGEEGDRP